jgi:hypothetical protein
MKNKLYVAALTLLIAATGGMMCPDTAKAEYYNYETAFYGGQYPGYRANGSAPVISAAPSYFAMPIVSAIPAPAPWVNNSPVHNWIIPTRFSDLTVDEVVYGPIRHYTMRVNGNPILQINNQNVTLRISQVYNLNGEDVVVVSSQSSQPGCTTRHYLISVRGEDARMSEIGHCGRTYDADVTNGALFITFADTFADWSVRRKWRYEAGSLRQL